MPAEYLRVLQTLQDGVPPKPFSDVLRTLAEELSDAERALLAYVDPTPLSTASLAQVHRATLTDGRAVVVKAQHRGVASLMRQDMENLKTVLSLVARFDADADFGPIVREWTSEVLKELDFRTEAVNQAEVRALLRERNVTAIVPETVPELVKALVRKDVTHKDDLPEFNDE
jgi:aarF domain-containing kinase